ncbi:MAG TPA: hypothetical protein VGK00_12070 [Anaerolineales bacterium]|jgi:DNA-directed RNA polymerase subunit RPC12/RpoP
MRGYRHHRTRFSRGRHSLNGLLWMVGLFILFYTGHWWPGILILVGVSALLSALPDGRADRGLTGVDQDQRAPSEGWNNPPARTPVIINLPPPSPAPASNAPRPDLLPANCPRCGAPVRTAEVKWTGSHSAACAYCGSNVLAAKTRAA